MSSTVSLIVNKSIALRRLGALRQSLRFLSSQPPKPSDSTSDDNKPPDNSQDFVSIKLEPGEWDAQKTDPLTRPPWKNSARILSAKDFANRPRAGFSEEFQSMHDAMVTLSWMSQQQTDDVYQSYLELMTRNSGETTSHEYVMRVLSQKYNITATRVAAIVQLAHNEEQQKKEGRPLMGHLQDYVDSKIQEHIEGAYGAFREHDPRQFVEDPLSVTGMGDPDQRASGFVSVDDVVNVDELEQDAIVRDEQEAQLAIDNKVYKEDVDESLQFVKVNPQVEKLITTQQSLTKIDEAQRSEDIKPHPANEQQPRQRWKYVAQTIDTRQDKKAAAGSSGKNKKRAARRLDNTLVEQDGELRVATIAEAKSTSWKPKRNIQEFTFAGVKQAWLERTLHAEKGGWGRQEAPSVVEEKEEAKEEAEAEEDDDAKELETASDSSDSSESESSDSSSDEEETPQDDDTDGEPSKEDEDDIADDKKE